MQATCSIRFDREEGGCMYGTCSSLNSPDLRHGATGTLARQVAKVAAERQKEEQRAKNEAQRWPGPEFAP